MNMTSIALLMLGLPPMAPVDGGYYPPSGITYEDARHYLCYQKPGPITIDGKLDDPGWQNIPWTSTFMDIEGPIRPLPRFTTQAKMTWDDQYFYVAADLEEPHVWGTLTEHDSVIFRDNDFEVFIDPDGDNHQYYEFEINALNTGWDLRLPKPYRDGGNAQNDWEIPGLKTAVHVRGTLNDPSDRDNGWSVEIAFPWDVLAEYTDMPCPPINGDHWRVNFSRVQWRHQIINGQYVKKPGLREDNWVWSPQGVINMHWPERWGSVQFSTEPIGTDTFPPDPAAPAREVLVQIYHAQKAYFDEHGQRAKSLKELGINPPGDLPSPQIELTDDGYKASIRVPGANDQPDRVLTIRQDSLMRSRPAD